MFIPTSSEFVALCRAQVALLTQGLGASLSVVYLTQELVEGAETRLVPVVAYPETAADWQVSSSFQLPPAIARIERSPRLLTDSVTSFSSLESHPLEPMVDFEGELDLEVSSMSSNQVGASQRGTLVTQRQMVLPLMHEEVVMGLLVTERGDRAWNEWEQSQIHEIANTLALACVLDQRYQWLNQDRRQQHLIQEQQHDILDNLLHQFRNSLTALQTFSKLILKRLVPGDANREIASSIVREATRLKELSQQLEAATTGMDEAEITPLSLPPAVGDWDEAIPLLPGAGVLAGAPLSLEPCSVVEVLTPLLASAGAIAEERSLTIYTDFPAHLPPAQANPQALREVLNNLIENALKYTETGGQILVQAGIFDSKEEDHPWIEVSISDTGPGISAQDLPHIFERRFRGAQAQSKIPGSGLGLAIAYALVEQMHGKIQVVSPAWASHRNRLSDHGEHPEAGTTFVVQLPAALKT